MREGGGERRGQVAPADQARVEQEGEDLVSPRRVDRDPGHDARALRMIDEDNPGPHEGRAEPLKDPAHRAKLNACPSSRPPPPTSVSRHSPPPLSGPAPFAWSRPGE